jgi:hypothetical protein
MIKNKTKSQKALGRRKFVKKAQEIYPAMQSPKIMIEQIEQLIK